MLHKGRAAQEIDLIEVVCLDQFAVTRSRWERLAPLHVGRVTKA